MTDDASPVLEAIRIVAPLRNASSMPVIVDAADGVRYVVKLLGAAQGRAALIAEHLIATLADEVGLPVPRRALVRLTAVTPTDERDTEVLDVLRASHGINLGFVHLADARAFDPRRDPAPSATLASRLVVFDAFVMNIDRTPKNPNLLVADGTTWCIDHGASLLVHQRAGGTLLAAGAMFARGHILAPWATRIAEEAAALHDAFTPAVLDRALAAIPDLWLAAAAPFGAPLPRATLAAVVHERRARWATWLADALTALPAA